MTGRWEHVHGTVGPDPVWPWLIRFELHALTEKGDRVYSVAMVDAANLERWPDLYAFTLDGLVCELEERGA